MTITEQEYVEQTIKRGKPKVCHITDVNPFGDGMSYCGLSSVRGKEQNIHSWDECLANHQLCPVCTAECERIHPTRNYPWAR